MNAYTYFKGLSLSVEPDMPVETAGKDDSQKTNDSQKESDTDEIIVSKDELQVSEKENPIANLKDVMKETADNEITVSHDENVIALIDTGVGESANVIDRISVIDDVLTSTGHGNDMLQAIVSQNPDAKVLSIRAMNDNGLGTISSLVAAMEYAINENADMMNLSLYARTTLSTSVLKSEIQKAVDAGITVIGAAGNDGVDVADYVPGSVESAYIIGAANEKGARLETSNFGATVDYNVVGDSTSDATAKFTGFVSKNGLEKVSDVLNQGMIYESGFGGSEEDIEEGNGEKTDVKPIEDTGEVFPVTIDVRGEAEIIFSNLDGSFVKKMSAKDEVITEDVPMTGVQVEVLAPMYTKLDTVFVTDKEGQKVLDTPVPEMESDVVDGIRNIYFVLDAMQEMNISVDTSVSENDVPRFDIVSESLYLESVLCDDNCLEDHIRKRMEPTLNEVDVVAEKGTNIYEGLLALQDEEGIQTAGLNFMPEAGQTYTGRASIISGNYPNGQNGSGASWSVRFGDGILENMTIGGFYCTWHGAANEVAGANGNYEATCTSVGNGTATFSITFKRDGWYTPTPDPSHPGWYFGYQTIGLSVTLDLPEERIDLSAVKNWQDQNNKYNTRPQRVGFQLQQRMNGGAWYDYGGIRYASASNNWTVSWNDELKKDVDGNEYQYRIREVVPENYRVDGGDTQHFGADGGTVTFTNILNNGYLKIIKESDNPAMTEGNGCYDLSGAEFEIYTDQACTKKAKYDGGKIVTEKVTNPDGTISYETRVVELVVGTYYVKETKAPKGFEINTEVKEAKVTVGHRKDVPFQLTFVDEAGNDPIFIELTKIWNGPETPTIPPLTGTQFTIKYYDNMNKDTSGTPTKTWIIELKKEKNGKYMATLHDDWLVKGSDPLYKSQKGNPILPYGTYSIVESKPAPGYTSSGILTDKNGNQVGTTDKPYVTLVQKGANGIHLYGGNEYTGKNVPEPTSIKIRKVDENGKPLQGAKFKLVDSNGKLVSTKTSGANGYAIWEDLYPDRYYVTEIQTANGYNLLQDGITIELPRRVTEEDIKKYNIDRSKLSEWDKEEKCYYLFDVTYEISNHGNFKAPMTGGWTDFMTFVPLIAGMGGLTGVGVVTMKRKRKKK